MYQTSGANGGRWVGDTHCPEKRMRICGQFLKIWTQGPPNDVGMTAGMFTCCRLPLQAILVAKGKNIVLLSIYEVHSKKLLFVPNTLFWPLILRYNCTKRDKAWYGNRYLRLCVKSCWTQLQEKFLLFPKFKGLRLCRRKRYQKI